VKEKYMLGNFFGSLTGKLLGGAIVTVLLGSGILYAGCSIKSCIRAQDRAAVAEKALEKTMEVQDEKAEIQQETHALSDQELADSFHSNGGGLRRK
jgi:hypothetical protein